MKGYDAPTATVVLVSVRTQPSGVGFCRITDQTAPTWRFSSSWPAIAHHSIERYFSSRTTNTNGVTIACSCLAATAVIKPRHPRTLRP